MKWQIRERGTGELLEEGDDLHVLLTCGYYDSKHYICRKGEMLVSEEELKELNDLKESHFRATVYAHDKLRISEEENAALKAELAELKGQQAIESIQRKLQEKEVKQERILRAAKIAEQVCELNIEKFRMLHGNTPRNAQRLFEIEQELATIINQGV